MKISPKRSFELFIYSLKETKKTAIEELEKRLNILRMTDLDPNSVRKLSLKETIFKPNKITELRQIASSFINDSAKTQAWAKRTFSQLDNKYSPDFPEKLTDSSWLLGNYIQQMDETTQVLSELQVKLENLDPMTVKQIKTAEEKMTEEALKAAGCAALILGSAFLAVAGAPLALAILPVALFGAFYSAVEFYDAWENKNKAINEIKHNINSFMTANQTTLEEIKSKLNINFDDVKIPELIPVA